MQIALLLYGPTPTHVADVSGLLPTRSCAVHHAGRHARRQTIILMQQNFNKGGTLAVNGDSAFVAIIHFSCSFFNYVGITRKHRSRDPMQELESEFCLECIISLYAMVIYYIVDVLTNADLKLRRFRLPNTAVFCCAASKQTRKTTRKHV